MALILASHIKKQREWLSSERPMAMSIVISLLQARLDHRCAGRRWTRIDALGRQIWCWPKRHEIPRRVTVTDATPMGYRPRRGRAQRRGGDSALGRSVVSGREIPLLRRRVQAFLAGQAKDWEILFFLRLVASTFCDQWLASARQSLKG